MQTCAMCETETDDEIFESNGGYCDDCVLFTMDPDWVKEHYPEYTDIYAGIPAADAVVQRKKRRR